MYIKKVRVQSSAITRVVPTDWRFDTSNLTLRFTQFCLRQQEILPSEL